MTRLISGEDILINLKRKGSSVEYIVMPHSWEEERDGKGQGLVQFSQERIQETSRLPEKSGKVTRKTGGWKLSHWKNEGERKPSIELGELKDETPSN